MLRPLEVVAAAIQDGSKYLICRRLGGLSAGGKWEFPGGKVDPGESAEDALEREIFEELGAVISVGRLLTSAVTDVGSTRIRLSVFNASLVGPLPSHSTDHSELRWVETQELLDFDWALPDYPAVHVLRGSTDEAV